MRILAMAMAGAVLAACAPAPRPASVRPADGVVAVARAEDAYVAARFLRDRRELALATGSDRSPEGVPIAELERRFGAARTALAAALDGVPDAASLAPHDARARDAMAGALDGELAPIPPAASPAGEEEPPLDCAYDTSALAARDGVAALRSRAYACYAEAAANVRFEDRTLDRLGVLARLATESDPARRRALFLALAPVWSAMAGDAGAADRSPYRLLLRADAARWAREGSPVAARSRALGVEPETLERWLVTLLERWRDATSPPAGAPPDEPWNWWHANGATARALASRVPRSALEPIVAATYGALGADLARLHVHFDLAPRPGKTAVAYCTFGARRRDPQPGIPAGPTEPWVLATYSTGGFDNLVELLHESGHAIHLAAIDARPALLDWPDADPLTEALGDLVALDAYEPAWQRAHLGTAVPLADAMRAKYAAIALDACWALLEIRLHRDPTLDPSAAWAGLTSAYLHLAPHPELAWWAMRGQLVDAPGYMANYGLGAFVAADLRARARALRGPFDADPSWYPWLSERLYRFGLARPSREVVEEFLGRPLSPEALLTDLERMRDADP